MWEEFFPFFLQLPGLGQDNGELVLCDSLDSHKTMQKDGMTWFVIRKMHGCSISTIGSSLLRESGTWSKSLLVENEGEIVGIFPLQMSRGSRALHSVLMGTGGAAVKSGIPPSFRERTLGRMYAHVEEIAQQ